MSLSMLCGIFLFFIILFATSATRGLRSIFWAAVGIIVLGLLGFALPKFPWDLFSLFLGISMINAAMSQSKGADYIAYLSLRFLQYFPTSFLIIAPILSYSLAFIFGSGSIALLLFPAIIKLAKQQRCLPANVLVLCMVSAQDAVVCSPISAINIYVWAEFLSDGLFSYSKLTALFLSGLLAVALTSTLLFKLYFKEMNIGITKADRDQLLTRVSKKEFFGSRQECDRARRSFYIFCATVFSSLLLLNISTVPSFLYGIESFLKWPAIDRMFLIFCISAGLMISCSDNRWDKFAQHPAFQAGCLGSLQVLVLGTFGTMFLSEIWPIFGYSLAGLLQKFL